MYLSTFIFVFVGMGSRTVVGICDSGTQSVTTVTGTYAPKGDICSGSVIFEETFSELNLAIWNHDRTLGGNSNNQFQLYNNNRSTTYVKNGILHFKPILLADEIGEPTLYTGTIDMNSWSPQLVCTNAQYDGCKRIGTSTNILNPIKSAKITTVNSFAFKYGKIEVLAKIPAGDWLWPAIWLMPRWNKYAGWPSSGEIDIMESRGNKQLTLKGVNIGTQQISSTLHWGPNSQYNQYRKTDYQTNNATGFHTAFHKYQLTWTPNNITFFIDGQQTGFVSPTSGGFWALGGLTTSGLDNPWTEGTRMAPFDSEYFLILNVAVGGTSFFSDSAVNSPYPKPWSNTAGKAAPNDFWNAKSNWYPTWNVNTDDSHFQIDSVKVWAL